MTNINNNMSPGEVLREVPGLTRDKLNYWVLKRYIDVVVDQRGNRKYNFFRQKDLLIIQKAYDYIIIKKMKDSEAFRKIYEELNK